MNLGEETVVDADSQRIELVTVECDNSSKDIRNFSVDNVFTDREEAAIDSVNQRIELLIVEGNKSSKEIKNFRVDKAFTEKKNMKLSEKTDIDSVAQQIELSTVESNNCSKEIKDSNDPKAFTDNNNTVRKKRKYSCEKCLYSAAKKWKLLEHMKYHEKIPGITLFECQKCPFKGPLKSQLDRHMMFLHQNEPDSKRYKCHICDSEFISKSSRSKHKKTHK
ncbi:hypothetical protein JTB14_005622 [Gonioctena quinquepunctata]|nr:hypothetical protein JTB14_005622 [Gonioctena quinquepunctata]